MREEYEDEKFRIEKVAGDLIEDSILSKSAREVTSERCTPALRLRE